MRRQYLYLLLVCVFAFCLRIVNLGAHGMGGDEKYSLFVSQFVPIGGANQQDVFRKPNSPYFTPKEFWKKKGVADFYEAESRSDNGSSALHALSLHYWSDLFGMSDASLRAMSVLFGVLLVALLYFFVLSLFESPNLALLAATLAAIEPLLVSWSQTIRTYIMTFFFCLLATHLFFKLLKAEEAKQRPMGLYVVYGISVFMTLMCHYSVFLLFALHGLIVLLFVRNLRSWIGLSLAMVIPALGLFWWLGFAGGQYTFKYMADSAYVYNLLATKTPQIGYLAPTSFSAVLVQIAPIVSNHFLPTNGLFDVLMGKKNLVVSLFVAVASLGIYGWVKHENLKKWLIAVVFGGAFFAYSESSVQFMLLSIDLILLAMLVQATFEQTKAMRQKYLSIWLLAVFPLLFLVVFAIQDQNTFRIQHKYAGYGMVFSVILVALALRKLWTFPEWVKYPMGVMLFLQLLFVGQTLQNIWNDRALRYSLSAKPRIKNPYQTLAQNIVKKYASGDTVVYPSYLGEGHDYDIAPTEYSVTDAQTTNFYLPKDAQYWQRIDRNEPNKVYLKKSNGTQELLFDFKGITYRY